MLFLIALVLLNKGNAPGAFDLRVQPGQWKAALGSTAVDVAPGGTLAATVAPHDVAVFVLDAAVTDATLRGELERGMSRARRHGTN